MTLEPPIATRPFQYKHGDRPLDGYVIQRGAGRGGFGEVYYAVSDSGREVALKLVHTYEQVELRGISQCMNLKSPHLVTIFDVRYGTDGRPWVVMEFVSGPSLRELLDAAPTGIGPAKAAFFLREIAKGLTYLHECGIVHRDLKPGNIFHENGYVKIGDYGLSKAMSMTRHSGQTVAVGTLHYMAPEIGEGRYDRGIDIYAMGALLFEMLTGQVPFFGSSPAEVLMKHLTADVNLTNVQEPFKSVIGKAMAKNPAERYQSVQEMVDAVFASDEIRQSVQQVSPESLSMPGGRAAGNFGGNFGAAATPPPINPNPPQDKWDVVADRIADRLADAGERIKRAGDRVADRLNTRGQGQPLSPLPRRAGPDQFTCSARGFLAIVAAGLAAFLAAVNARSNDVPQFFFFTLLSVIGAWVGAALAWKLMGKSLAGESKWVARLAIGAPVGVGAMLFGIIPAAAGDANLGPAMTATFFSLLLLEWDQRIVPTRKSRFSVGHLFTSGILALILCGVFNCRYEYLVVLVVTGTSLAVGLWAKWGAFPAAQWASPLPRPVPPPAPGQMPPPIPPAGTGATAAAPPAQSPFTQVFPPSKSGRPGSDVVGLCIAGLVLFMVFANHGPLHSIPGLLFPGIIIPFVLVAFAMKRHRLSSAVTAPGASTAGQVTVGGVVSGFSRFVLLLVGGIILLVSLLLSLAVAADVPQMLASAFAHTHFEDDMRRAYGMNHWSQLMREEATLAFIILALFSLVPILLARRAGGGLHMLRAVLGIGLLFAAIQGLGHTLPSPSSMDFDAQPNQIISDYLHAVRMDDAFKPMLTAVCGYAIILWPPRRRLIAAAPRQTPAEQTK